MLRCRLFVDGIVLSARAIQCVFCCFKLATILKWTGRSKKMNSLSNEWANIYRRRIKILLDEMLLCNKKPSTLNYRSNNIITHRKWFQYNFSMSLNVFNYRLYLIALPTKIINKNNNNKTKSIYKKRKNVEI